MKIDGDTVTIFFEMRSGREHNTPDKAMWGFKVNIWTDFVILLLTD